MNNRFYARQNDFLSGVLATAMAVTMLPAIPAMAEDTVEKVSIYAVCRFKRRRCNYS